MTTESSTRSNTNSGNSQTQTHWGEYPIFRAAGANNSNLMEDSLNLFPAQNRSARRFGGIEKLLLVVVSAGVLAGCSSGTTDGKSDHAYIRYWPPKAGDGRLRLAVKDLIDMKGLVTTAGAEHFAKRGVPATRDAECLAIARERNVQIVGKTNVTELALGVTGRNEYFGIPKNPASKRRDLIPGGSSSGSAVAVANGTADVALGTDTAGSIRVPAACCGVTGLKTTFGLVSAKGVYPISAKHLDTVGPMAKDISGLVQGMDLLQRGFAAKYREAKAAAPSARGITIGRLYVDGTSRAVDEAVDAALKAKGFRVVVLPASFKAYWEQAEQDGRTVAVADGWLTNRELNAEPGITAGTKAVFALGASEYKVNYPNALERRAAWQRELKRTFRKVDFIALPTLKGLPPTVPMFGGTPALEALTLSMQNTVAVNYAGNPAVAVPVPLRDKDGSVTSLQLIGPRLSEAQLLNAARLAESKR